jgi:hypothetical protein
MRTLGADFRALSARLSGNRAPMKPKLAYIRFALWQKPPWRRFPMAHRAPFRGYGRLRACFLLNYDYSSTD